MLTEKGGVPTRLNYFANAHARRLQQLSRYHDKANGMEVNRNKTKLNQTKLQTKLNSVIVHFRIYYKRISVALIFIFNMKKEESRVKG